LITEYIGDEISYNINYYIAVYVYHFNIHYYNIHLCKYAVHCTESV